MFKDLEDKRDFGLMSKDQFLDQFPKKIIGKGGELIPIREELEKRF